MTNDQRQQIKHAMDLLKNSLGWYEESTCTREVYQILRGVLTQPNPFTHHWEGSD